MSAHKKKTKKMKIEIKVTDLTSEETRELIEYCDSEKESSDMNAVIDRAICSMLMKKHHRDMYHFVMNNEISLQFNHMS